METVRSKTVQRAAVVRPAAAPAPAARRVQASSLRVSSPNDPAEKEADRTAKQVMRMSVPEGSVARVPGGVFRRKVKEEEKDKPPRPKMESPYVARFAGAMGGEVQRQGEGAPNVAANVAAEIQASTGSGSPLPLSVRRFMEPRFNADFSGVRVHTGEKSAKLNRQLNARAFAVGEQIFFGRGQFQPETAEGRELIAHELTHTVQQGAAPQVQRSEDVSVTEQAPRQVQRLGIGDALNHFANAANAIPGFRMFTIILGVNPINMSRVERSAANILRAMVEFIPGGALIVMALDNYGVFERAGAWVEQQIRALGMTGSLIRDSIDRFLDSLSWTDIFDLGGVWERAKAIFTEPIGRIVRLAVDIGSGILQMIKDAILRPLAGLAQQTRGYDLLRAVLGRDPITREAYPRNADTLIGGFMKLIGQEEVWADIKKANAVARAWAWFQGALAGLMGFVAEVPALFMNAVRSLEIADIVVLPRAFARVGGAFLEVAGRFFSWAGAQVMSLLQIIFEVVAPGAMVYLRRAAGAFTSILRNPVGFVGNLVRAGIQGFRQFAANFLTHLRTSLVGWLTGAIAGANIYVPQALTLREIIRFVLSVLGITWQNLRTKIVRVVGEPATRAMETGFDLVMTLVTQGPAAAWERIQESLSNLREMVMEQIMTYVRDRIVQRAITTLLTSLNPAGAFVQAVLAIYNTVMFFVERLRQIGQVAMSFIDSIAAIAAGTLAPAANRVEQTMGRLLTLVISFLARLAGLGNVGQQVLAIVNRVRAPVDRALDRVVDWIVTQARRLGRLAVRGATALVEGVIRSVTAARRITLTTVAPTVLADVGRTPAGAVLFENRRGEGNALLRNIVGEHPSAQYNASSGSLTLPPVGADAIQAPTLRGMAERLGRQTGVTRITLSKSRTGWALDAQVNPTLAGLASHAPGNALQPLLERIRAEEVRVHPSRDTLMAIILDAATAVGATVQFARTGARTDVHFTMPGTTPAAEFRTYIVMEADTTCPSCGARPGVTRPHNVIPGAMWGRAIDAEFGVFGVTAPTGAAPTGAAPTGAAPTGAAPRRAAPRLARDRWMLLVRAAGTSETGPAVTEDTQCRGCEEHQDRTDIPVPHSLIQRRAGVAAGYRLTTVAALPAAEQGPAFVGTQFGVPGAPRALTDDQIQALTVLKADHVLDLIVARMRMAPTSPTGGERPASSGVYQLIVLPGRIDEFRRQLRVRILAEANAARPASSY